MIRSWLSTAADALVAAAVGGPVRATLLGAALLWLGYRYLGWITLALVAAGAAFELVKYPGRLPRC